MAILFRHLAFAVSIGIPQMETQEFGWRYVRILWNPENGLLFNISMGNRPEKTFCSKVLLVAYEMAGVSFPSISNNLSYSVTVKMAWAPQGHHMVMSQFNPIRPATETVYSPTG